MNIDPKQKSGRFVMMALAAQITALQAICDDPQTSEDNRADASNDGMLFKSLMDGLNDELDFESTQHPEWITRGKSITQLIKELGSFEDQALQVRLTFDGGQNHYPISILTRRDGYAMIEYCGL